MDVGRYILVDRVPVPCEDLFAWGYWLETHERHVADDTIDGVRVSTVFLGLDHNFDGSGPALVFETCVFRPDGSSEIYARYPTWEMAIEGHRAALSK